MTSLDDAMTRRMARDAFRDAKKLDPAIRARDPEVSVACSREDSCQRHMSFTYRGVEVSGYFHTVAEVRAAGWDAWIEAQKSKRAYPLRDFIEQDEDNSKETLEWRRELFLKRKSERKHDEG